MSSEVAFPVAKGQQARFECQDCEVVEVHDYQTEVVCWLCGTKLHSNGTPRLNKAIEDPEAIGYAAVPWQMMAGGIHEDEYDILTWDS